MYEIADPMDFEQFENLEILGTDDDSVVEYNDVVEYVDRGKVDNSEDVVIVDNDIDTDYIRDQVDKAINRYMDSLELSGVDGNEVGESIENEVSETEKPVYIFNLENSGNDSDSVSFNQCVILDDTQFQILLNAINENTEKIAPVIEVQNESVSSDLIGIQNTGEANFVVSVMIFGLLFGYMVKETVFRGV